MSMASVHAGSFDIENEKLVFRAAGKPDEVSSIFEREVEKLNEMAEKQELTFVSVCANQRTVFVAANNPYGWALVFEINAIHPVMFEIIEDKVSYNGTTQRFFGRNASVKMICCSCKDQAAVLIINDNNVGSVWIRTLGDKGEASMEKQITGISWERYFKTWLQCPVYHNDREQCIAMIACGEMHCAALTTAGDVFTCIFPNSDDVPADLPTWTISRNWAALAFEGGDCQRALQTIVDDMDCEFMYKTRSDPMAASFGVTGGLRNPYLLNINTDGEYADQVEEYHNNEMNSHIEENKRISAERKKNEREMKLKKERDLKRIRELEGEVQTHQKRGEDHKNVLEDAARKFEEAKKVHDEAQAAHANHKTELDRLTKELHREHQKSMGIHSTSVDTHTPSTNTPSSHTRNNTISASSKPQKKGFFSKLFGNEPANAENELHFEDIARFSASPEHRCTYI